MIAHRRWRRFDIGRRALVVALEMREITMEAATAIELTASGIMNRQSRQPTAKRPNCSNYSCKFGSSNGYDDSSGVNASGNASFSVSADVHYDESTAL